MQGKWTRLFIPCAGRASPGREDREQEGSHGAPHDARAALDEDDT